MKYIRKIFGIRDHEILVSLLMQLYIFLIISALLLIKSTVNALFLSDLGADNLSYAYVLVAFSAVITSYFYNKTLQKNSIKKLVTWSLGLFGLLFLLLFALLSFEITNQFTLYFYYVSVALFGVITTSQFWLLANMIYNARQAKRLFSFIGAGAIAGGILGGYLTSLIAINFGNKYVILTASILILSCIPLFFNIWKIKFWKLQKLVFKQKANRQSKFQLTSFKLITKSKHLSYLAIITGVGVLVAKLIDFQFSDFASKAISNSDSLASFFGFWFSTFNVLALCIQLFFTNRLLSYFGISANLLVLPLGIAFGCLLFLTFPELWVLIIIKGLDGGLKQSLNKAAMELSILPIPLRIKRQAKSYIDVVVDSVSTGIAGLILYFIIRKSNLETSYITVIILFFLFIWIVLVYKLREEYFNSFKSNLMRNIENEHSQNKKLVRGSSIKSAIKIFKEGDEKSILQVLDGLENYKLLPLKDHIIDLLEYPSKKIKLKAIRHLHVYKKGTATEKVIKLINSKDYDIVHEAMEYLLLRTDIKNKDIFVKYLDSEDQFISNAALLCLVKESVLNKSLEKKYNIDGRIEEKVLLLKDQESNTLQEQKGMAKILLTIAIARNRKYYPLILQSFESSNRYLVIHAIKAAGLTKEASFIPGLIQLLEHDAYRVRINKALRKFGSNAAISISTYLEKEYIPDTIRVHIPEVLSPFRNKYSMRLLVGMLKDKNASIRHQSSKTLLSFDIKGKVKISQSILLERIAQESLVLKKSISLLLAVKVLKNEGEISASIKEIQDFLLSQRDLNIKIIFNLLSIQYDNSYIEVAYNGIKSRKKDVRANALEFLDNFLPPKLKPILFPLIENGMIEVNEDKLQENLILIHSSEDFYKLLSTYNNKYINSIIESQQS